MNYTNITHNNNNNNNNNNALRNSHGQAKEFLRIL